MQTDEEGVGLARAVPFCFNNSAWMRAVKNGPPISPKPSGTNRRHGFPRSFSRSGRICAISTCVGGIVGIESRARSSRWRKPARLSRLDLALAALAAPRT